jgi:hypothetical protein
MWKEPVRRRAVKSTIKIATASALALVLALPALTPAQAHRHHHKHHVHYYGQHVRHAAHYRDFGRSNERNCTKSPSSHSYEPCMNRP